MGSTLSLSLLGRQHNNQPSPGLIGQEDDMLLTHEELKHLGARRRWQKATREAQMWQREADEADEAIRRLSCGAPNPRAITEQRRLLKNAHTFLADARARIESNAWALSQDI